MEQTKLHYEITFLEKLSQQERKFKHRFHMDEFNHSLALNIASSMIERDKADLVYIRLMLLDNKNNEQIHKVETVKRKKNGKIVASHLDGKQKKVVEVEI